MWNGTCASDLEVCKCVCHTLKGVSHVAACCKECPNCKQRIRIAALECHAAHCTPRLFNPGQIFPSSSQNKTEP